MPKTGIFLSSTCYDLRATREHIKSTIETIGYEIFASEYHTFPVDPDLTTIDNCRKVIREHADLFVLIVGGARGSFDAHGKCSVVNLEYREAKANRLDCFVFVDRRVWDLFPIFKNNPTANFKPTVDDPEVFKFIEEVKSASKWIFTFDQTADIIDTLKVQLSNYLKSLIDRKRANTLAPPPGLEGLSVAALDIVREKPKAWEYELIYQLLREAIDSAKQRIADLDSGLSYHQSEILDESSALNRIQQLTQDASNIVARFDPTLKAIMAGCGPQGTPGDAIAIAKACKHASVLFAGAADWEAKIRFIKPPEKFEGVYRALYGTTADLVTQFEPILPQLRDLLDNMDSLLAAPGPHRAEIKIDIKTPATIARACEEMERIKRNRR